MGKARLAGAIVGLAMIVFGVASVLANGSDRAAAVADELVEASTVTPENEGKLVIVSGTPALAEDDIIVDEEADLKIKSALYYSRVPYQKVYVLKSRKVVVDKGDDLISTTDDETKTEYYVAEEWINANHKRDEVITRTARRYENPPAVNLKAFHATGDLRLAGFKISPVLVSDYIQTQKGWFPAEVLQEYCEHYIIRSELDLKAVTDDLGRGMLSNGDEIGCVHVTFSFDTLTGAEPVTVIGRQREGELVADESGLITESEATQAGVVSREAFLDSISGEDSSSRAIGYGFVAAGVVLALVSVLDFRALIGTRA